ncbi:hypothetical protein ScPMuIL_014924 [Solemya velum]
MEAKFGSVKRHRDEAECSSNLASKCLKSALENSSVNSQHYAENICSQATDRQVDSEQYLCDSAEDRCSNNDGECLQHPNGDDATDTDSQKTEIMDSESSFHSGVGDNILSRNSSTQGRLSRESTENYSIGQQGQTEISSTSSGTTGSNHDEVGVSVRKIVSVQRDAAIIASVVGGVDVDEAYEKLKSHRSNPNRVDLVTNEILESDQVTVGKPGNLEKEDSLPTDLAFRNNPLYRDMHIVSKVLPDKDPNEIYAFLEAHHDKSNRILIVIQELTKTDSLEYENIPKTEKNKSDNENKSKGTNGQRSSFEDDIDQLKDIFPDCDPNYLYTKLEEQQQAPGRVATIAANLFEHKNYPKLKPNIETNEGMRRQQHYANLRFDIVDFLHKFPNPKMEFQSEIKSMSGLYKEHCLIQLKNEFPNLKDGYIKKVFEGHNHHFTPTLSEIQQEIPHLRDGSKKIRRRQRVTKIPFPDEPDELFFHELLYSQHELEIKDYLVEKENCRAVKIHDARENKELYECGCCFDDECLFEEMSSCADGHLFCNSCVKGSAESAIGEGKTKFPCLTGDCEYCFPLTVLQSILSPNKFSIALRKMQEEELRQANIPDLVSCPFCSFATIMSNPDDNLFKCLNPDCLKESCRLCQEPNHIPLRCSEVEKQGETSMRKFIELKMTEAMFRVCPKCSKRFYKEEGCSMMTCPCGQTMCYACRESGIDYDHFASCPVKDHNVQKLHQLEMEKAAASAKEKYLEEHPEAQDIILMYDPFKHLQDLRERNGVIGAGSEDQSDSDGEDW